MERSRSALGFGSPVLRLRLGSFKGHLLGVTRRGALRAPLPLVSPKIVRLPDGPSGLLREPHPFWARLPAWTLTAARYRGRPRQRACGGVRLVEAGSAHGRRLARRRGR